MKKLILTIALLFVCIASYAQKTEYTFQSGDTTAYFTVNNAKAVYFTIKDSTMTGTDSLYLALTFKMSNGLILKSVISVHLLSTTTTTTFIASSLLIPADATTATWVWYPAGVSGADVGFTGTFYITRLNGVNASTPYLPKTRIMVRGQ